MNMSYCRFANTRRDLDDCLGAIRRDERVSGDEAYAGKMMFREFLAFCRDCDIIGSYDDEAVNDLFDALQEGA